MCNAWNHPINCTCGWGGQGHLGRRTTGNQIDPRWAKYREFTGASSYTNPNALCPVCGEQVFFYQSPDGGRVFFDSLGPPWPKHPCTTKLPSKDRVPQYQFSSGRTKTYQWEKDGWTPFIVDHVIPQPPQFKITNLRGEIDGLELSLYTRLKGLTVKAPYLVRRRNDGNYDVSTYQFPRLTGLSKEFRFVGFTSAFAAAEDLNRPKVDNRPGVARKLDNTRQARPGSQTPARNENRKSPSPKLEGPMQAAFKMAEIKKG